MADDLAAAILASAQRLGVNPVDLGTTISYETAGTFDPWKAGPTTKWGQHRGLIQWGEPQRQKYGVYQGQPVGEQLQAAEKYLTDAGVRPGASLMDLYSAINAGGVGRENRSDAAAGGAWGTVADKVKYQMADHRKKAEALLGGKFTPGPASTGGAAQPGPQMAAAAPALGPAPSAFFGDIVAPQAAPDFGTVIGNYAAQRKQRADAEQAEAIRRQALLGSVGDVFG